MRTPFTWRPFFHKMFLTFCTLTFLCASQLVAAHAHKNAFIDPPATTHINFLDKAADITLISALDEYEKIEKTNLSLLPSRVEKLTDIQKLIELNYPDKKNYQRLKKRVEEKKWYLEELQKLYKLDAPLAQLTEQECSSGPYQPLFLVNKVLYDYNLPTYWGLFWLEAIDPCHRFLTGHYLKWQKTDQQIPFFLWLETQEFGFNAIQVEQFDQQTLLDSTLTIRDGLFYQNGENTPATYDDEHEYIFILTLTQNLIVSQGSESVRHLSLSHGAPVLGVGALKIKEGRLIYIDAESGHYQPTPESLMQSLRIFEANGAKLDAHIEVKYYTAAGVISESYKDFYQKYGTSTLSPPDLTDTQKTFLF